MRNSKRMYVEACHCSKWWESAKVAMHRADVMISLLQNQYEVKAFATEFAFPSPLSSASSQSDLILQHKSSTEALILWPPIYNAVCMQTHFNHSHNDWWLTVVKPQLFIHYFCIMWVKKRGLLIADWIGRKSRAALTHILFTKSPWWGITHPALEGVWFDWNG